LRHDYKPVIFLVNNGGYTSIDRGSQPLVGVPFPEQ